MSARFRWSFLAPAAAGSAVSAGLWLSDLLGLSRYSFAGVTDAEAAERVLDVTQSALLSLELRLFFFHLAVGAVTGTVAALAWRGLAPTRSTSRETAAAAGFTLALFVLALLGMVGWYPQLFSDRWWISGGPLASLQLLVTHGLGPRWFDLAALALMAAAFAGALRGPGRGLLSRNGVSALRKSAIATSLVAVAVLALGATLFSVASSAGRAADLDSPPNLLILASDSLRSDRIESEEVMPFTARRIEKGTLYRYAITPIARTYPGWVATLTGTEPRRNGVRHMFPTLANRRDVGPTLFTELRDDGYFTFAVSDFAGDVFPGFEGGFESLDTPHLTADTLAQSTALTNHTWTLPFLRFAAVRSLFPAWRNAPSLADPEWVADGAIRQLEKSGSRPFAGLVFFSTAHFPYVAPFPYYRKGAGGYRGRYLFQVPPVPPEEAPGPEDVEQIRHRYDAALTSIDHAMERLLEHLRKRGLAERTLVVITGDHGEELYEQDGIAGHGDTIRHLRSQAVPVFLQGPGVEAGARSSAQVRHYDLAATALALLDPARPRDFGDGTSLLEGGALRPVCLETGIWFWPEGPSGLRGTRLEYPGISELLTLEPASRELVLRDEVEALVESAKERGLLLGRRLYREQLTPRGRERETLFLSELEPAGEEVDLEKLFQERCVEGDPSLRRLYGAVVFERKGESR